MNTTANTKPFFHFPFFIAPARSLFADRAVRFDELADAEPNQWQDYLKLLAQISRAQHQVLMQLHAPLPALNPNPEHTVLPTDGEHLLPDAFYPALRLLISALSTEQLPQTAQSSLNTLNGFTQAQAQAAARRWLQQQIPEHEHKLQIWLAAASQCAWTAWTVQLEEDDVPTRENRQACPCCGGDAVSSLIYSGGDRDGLRYLHCARCNSQWHALRAKCTFCGDQSALTRHSIENGSGALAGASAEYCGKCAAYRKILNRQQQQYADPIADDLATLALDILMGEQNKPRGGANPFFIG